MQPVWRKCSSCKGDILCGQAYYVCSVSTCQGKTTNYAFCGINCWDAHIPTERHRPDSAGAIERRAPGAPDEPGAGGRKILVSQGAKPAASGDKTLGDDELLVVVSKVRKYIADKSGMNTSAGVYVELTDRIKRICDLSIQEARNQGRKTVMDRDVPT